jgi:hypothetical protein
VSVATESVVSANDGVVGWGEGKPGFARASEAGSDWTMSKPRELGGGSGLAMPDGGRGQELEGRSDYGVKVKQKQGENSGARHDE